MKLFSEKVTPTLTSSSLNILQVENFKEIFFGVYEVEINKNKYPVEQISEQNGNPVVSIPVEVEGKVLNFPFVLTEGKFEVFFNQNSEYTDNYTPPENETPQLESSIDDDFIFENTEFSDDQFADNRKHEILEEIKRAKQSAIISAKKEIELDQKRKLKNLKEASDKKEEALKSYLKSAKQDLVNEFVSISNKIKHELVDDNQYKYSEIKETIDNRIRDLADSLSERIEINFSNSSKEFDSSIRTLVTDLYESYINPKVDKNLTEIAQNIGERVSEIDSNLNEKLKSKAELKDLENINSEVFSIREATVELNNSLNKNINKTLSRIGNVDKKVENLESLIHEEIENKITSIERDVMSYYNNRIQLLEDRTFNINEETRKYFINLSQESRDGLIDEIRGLKNETPVNYIIESNGKKQTKDFKSIQKEFDKKISSKIDDEIVKLKKYISVYSSGGGTVAQQFADGGTMNGNLNIIGNILSGGTNLIDIISNNSPSGSYLSLSGGTITGGLSVSGPINLNYNTSWYDVPYSYTDSNQISVSGTTSVLSISTLNSNVNETLNKVNVLYDPNATYYNSGSSYSIQGTVGELLVDNAFNISVIQQTLTSEQAQINNLDDRVNALYSYLVQNFDQNIVVSSNSINQFVTNEWSSSMGLVPGSTVTLSAANLVYILGNSDGSSPNDYFELNLKPNFLFYKTNLSDYSILDAFPLSAMKSSKYVLQVEDRTTGDIYYSELNIVANNSFAIASEYSSNYTTNSPFVEFGATLVNQRVCLSAVAITPSDMSNFIFKGNRTNFF